MKDMKKNIYQPDDFYKKKLRDYIPFNKYYLKNSKLFY